MRERRDSSGGPEVGALTYSTELVGGCRFVDKKTKTKKRGSFVAGSIKTFLKKKKKKCGNGNIQRNNS